MGKFVFARFKPGTDKSGKNMHLLEKESVLGALVESFVREQDVDGDLGTLRPKQGQLFLAIDFVDLGFV